MTDIPPLPPPAQAPARLSGDLLTPGMIEALRGTKPWVRFLSVLGFVMVGFITLVGLGMGGVGIYQALQGSPEALLLVGLGFFYLLMAILYLFPSRFLFRYASAIGEALEASSKSASVERALRQQKSFWKFAGIMALITLLLYVPGVVAAIAIPNLLTAMQRSKQKRSIADMQTIEVALQRYAADHHSYPAVTTIEELAPLLEPHYASRLPRVDGWGNPFVYEPDGCDATRCSGYYLASTGRNGVLEQEALSDYGEETVETTHFDDDIVILDGELLRRPRHP